MMRPGFQIKHRQVRQESVDLRQREQMLETIYERMMRPSFQIKHRQVRQELETLYERMMRPGFQIKHRQVRQESVDLHQREQMGHSEIYPSTLNVVSNCPSHVEYNQRSSARCADVCESYMQVGNCAYHCMRDSSKTKLVEFCAKPKPLFEYCPEYDPVDQTIQKDLATLCNSTSSRNYYNSSDIYFCDPDNCLQLYESSVRSGATTLTTLINEKTEMNGGDNQEWVLPLCVALVILCLAILIGSILLHVFIKRGISSARIRRMTKKRHQHEKQNGCTEKMIPYQM